MVPAAGSPREGAEVVGAVAGAQARRGPGALGGCDAVSPTRLGERVRPRPALVAGCGGSRGCPRGEGGLRSCPAASLRGSGGACVRRGVGGWRLI